MERPRLKLSKLKEEAPYENKKIKGPWQTFHQGGKHPVICIWLRVLRRPYLCTACWPALNPSPYTWDMSDSIWCLKNSPSFFSYWDPVPLFNTEEADDELDATLLPDMSLELNHMWARTWQIPSSTSWLRVR